MSTPDFAKVEDVADAFLAWFERYAARHPAGERPTMAVLVQMWTENYDAPELLTTIRRLRPDLVEDVGTSADVTRHPWVADIAQVFTWSACPSGWPIEWRALLLQERPRLARRLARAEVVLDRHVAAQAAGEGIEAGWDRALATYDDVLLEVTVWLDRIGSRS